MYETLKNTSKCILNQIKGATHGFDIARGNVTNNAIQDRIKFINNCLKK